jgi:recombination protein RecT
MNQRYTPPKNAPAQQQQGAPPAKTLVDQINDMMPEMAKALPKHISPDRMARVVITEIRKTPDLLKCDPTSFFGALLYCAQLGLEPGSARGHAYLIPRKRKDGSYECQLIVGYQGYLDLVERGGNVTLEARCVYENDIIEIEYGTNPVFRHKPALKDRGAIVGAYAFARYKDGRSKGRFLTTDEIELARKASDNKSEYGPWAKYYDEMATKTAIRRLVKQLPKSIELGEAVHLEDRYDAGETIDLRAELPKELAAMVPEPAKPLNSEAMDAFRQSTDAATIDVPTDGMSPNEVRE